MNIFKNKYFLFSIIAITVLFVILTIIIRWYGLQFYQIGQIEIIPTPIPLDQLEEIMGRNEREIAFLQEGDIWLLSKDLKKKYKIIDTEETIINFSISSDGKEIYWLNGKRELWKKEEGKLAIPLAGIPGKIEYEKYKGYIEEYKKEFFEICKKTIEPYEKYYEENVGKFDELGGIKNFELSPDGEYIAYEPLGGYTTCCGGVFNVPVTSLWIMKKGGTEKIETERPSGVWRDLIFFDGWLPDSKKILFHFSAPDEETQGSPYFEVGMNGKNPEVYTEIFKFFKEGVGVKVEEINIGEMTIMLVGTEPVYSPSGEKVAYIKEGNQVHLRDIKTKETKTILELENLPFDSAANILNWSEDGSLLLVKGINKVFIFDKKGDVVFERKFGKIISDYPGIVLINSVLLSYDNKYLGGVYKTAREKPEIIFFENIITREKKEFTLPELEYPSKENNVWPIYTYPQFFSKQRNFYYLRKAPGADVGELWVIDTNIWKNYKVTNNVSRMVIVP